MKILLISDTHWRKLTIPQDDLNTVELIVLLWDVEEYDISEIIYGSIPIIWVHWNSDINPNWYNKYNITDIHLNKYNFKNISFFWLEWNTSYYLQNNDDPSIREDLEKFLTTWWVDILISHFPSIERLAKWNSYHSAHGTIEDYIHIHRPKYHFHGHIHINGTAFIWNTKIQCVYWWKIVDISK